MAKQALRGTGKQQAKGVKGVTLQKQGKGCRIWVLSLSFKEVKSFNEQSEEVMKKIRDAVL